MKDDLLDRATRALRDSAVPDAGDVTRARLARSLRRPRRSARWITLPIAASFVAFGVWASASGRLQRWVGAASDVADVERAAPSPPPPPPPVVVVPPAEAPAPVEAPARPSDEPPPAPVKVPPPAKAPLPVTPEPAATTAPVASADGEAVYREAHEAHFVTKDYAAALALWERYLGAGGGRFTLEARYNRAICLVRLQRRDAARTALLPFANGDYGGYRRDEAARLLRSLD